MQINVHDVKNQKKDIIAEIVIFAKAIVFYCFSGEIKPFGLCLEKWLTGKCLDNVLYWNPWLGVLLGNWNLGKHKEVWRTV